MWSYYGAKTNLVGLYPPPKYGIIIEPFAGSARYALRYYDREVILVDKYPVIINIWKWLQSCSEADILKLPASLPLGTDIDTIPFDCQEARDFYGFMIGCADARPRKKTTIRKTIDRPNFTNFGLKRVAKNLFKIREWKFICGDYTDCPDVEATHFIDPPYEFGGSAYVMSSLKIDFPQLADWSRSRKGQIIVCENTKATWMDFKPMVSQRGSLHTTTEAIWTNHPTSIGQSQGNLFQIAI